MTLWVDTPACIVTPEFPGPMLSGGLGTAVYWQARTLRETGIPVVVFCTGDVSIKTPEYWSQHFKEELEIEFIESATWMQQHSADAISRNYYPNYHNLIRAAWVQEFLTRNDFQIVYLQDYGGHGLRALQAKKAGISFLHTEFILTMHGSTEWALEGLELFATSPEQLVLEYQESESVRLADTVVSPSAYLRNWVVERWRIPPSLITVIPYCFEGQLGKGVIDFESSFRHLVFFGRLETRKGLELFVESILESDVISEAIEKVTFLGKCGQVAGSAADRWLNQKISNRVPFEWEIIDNRDTFQAWQWLAEQSDILVVAPSLSDNLPYAIIELFQRHLPFVSTVTGGIPEIVGQNPKILVEPNVVAIRERLSEIISSGRLTIRYDTGFDPLMAKKGTISLHRGACSALRDANSQNVFPITNHENPEVSVIVPHFNSIGYLRYALQSLSDQDCTFPYEVIVIDDASTIGDHRIGFEELNRQYADDGRFHFIMENENHGAGATRNYGASLARGRYLAFFDADNEAYPYFLSVYRSAIKTSNCDIMTCYVDMVKQDDFESPTYINRERIDLYFTPPGACIEAGFFLNTYGDTASICTREAFDRVGGFSSDSPNYEKLPSGDWDWDFFAKSALNGLQLGVVPQALFCYRDSIRNQQNTNKRYYYRNRSIMLARYSTPEARKRIDWYRMLAILQNVNQAGNSNAPGLYEYLAHLSDDRLLAVMGGTESTTNDHSIKKIRERLQPLIYEWVKHPPKVFIYGAGLHTRVMLGAVPELAKFVVGLIDRTGGESDFLNWPVIKPNTFDARSCDVVVYSSKEHERSMYQAFAQHPIEHVLIYV